MIEQDSKLQSTTLTVCLLARHADSAEEVL